MSYSGTKVVVIGGAGQAGKIHVGNLLGLGAEVACFDVVENPDCSKNYDAKSVEHSACVADGFKYAIVALPDNMLYPHTDKILDAGFERVLIEKPGSLNSEDLKKLNDKATAKGIAFTIDYQRSFDGRVSKLTEEIKSLVADGYKLDYVSVYSCDKAQPPQAAHQALNQGCHDYALLLGILEATNVSVKELQARGVNWGELKDTKFLKITGTATGDDNEAIFDVQMGRVNSTGTFTEFYVKLSKYDQEKDMYTPFETKLNFPEIPDPDSLWSDVWAEAFKNSAEALLKGEGGVPVSFGVSVLEFAEKAIASLS
mmetsp:Transcript_6506/g.7439  ORF Transcript_6506/g.7439 Transcript_6506/m.7439 type:complete len:313 (-) Transcript_6506:187-1125(-)|eukprot:CAMPEP_0184022492 /NCGR_PEP_ID=MMETSP0954-20121128/10642_1 /TAXON_ID=627963 /ORGANISM="Aplanochytrium sp, Strain PBS07" /LENGTH=312 /DNA_ID=CAMNT_0026304885 /DNA_START=305 /DNA_END=1243 /DNA_ORIENTATION=-